VTSQLRLSHFCLVGKEVCLMGKEVRVDADGDFATLLVHPMLIRMMHDALDSCDISDLAKMMMLIRGSSLRFLLLQTREPRRQKLPFLCAFSCVR
jgi:hypothetical protein